MNNMTLCFWISTFIAFICCAIIFIKIINYMENGCSSSSYDTMKPSTIIVIILFTISIFCLVIFGYYSGLFDGKPPVQIIYNK